MNYTIISGSQNRASITFRAVKHLEDRLARELTEDKITIIDVRDYDIPLDIQVYQDEGDAPEHLTDLVSIMYATDAFILVTPEYNGCYTPALKNLLNHFPKFSHKPIGIVTASDGALGGMRAAQQLQLLSVAHFGIPSATMLVIPRVHKLFEEDGTLVDETFQRQIDNFIREFIWLSKTIYQQPIGQ